MMTTSKSGPLAGFKYLLTIPVLTLTFSLLALNFNIYGQKDNKDNVYDNPDVMPTYNGGSMNEVRKDIQENLVYPESAIKNNISAKIFVQFVIDENGKVEDVKVIRVDIMKNATGKVLVNDYSPLKNPQINAKAVADLENEAIRVIKSLKGFTPAKKDGKNVKLKSVFPIVFVLG